MRPHRHASVLSHAPERVVLVVVLVVAFCDVARAQVEVQVQPTEPPTQPPTQPPTPADVSAPASVPARWEPGVTIEQLPAGAYPEATTDGGMLGRSFTLGAPTRGIWGGSLWLTFHGLQWPYMPKTGVGVSGYAWVDTGYEQIRRDQLRTDRQFWLQEARGLLRLTPT